jgi:hypothetical protein
MPSNSPRLNSCLDRGRSSVCGSATTVTVARSWHAAAPIKSPASIALCASKGARAGSSVPWRRVRNATYAEVLASSTAVASPASPQVRCNMHGVSRAASTAATAMVAGRQEVRGAKPMSHVRSIAQSNMAPRPMVSALPSAARNAWVPSGTACNACAAQASRLCA